ncbi:hypothetical protein R83H12_00421 [Fibrobacteria bacterium R8-3-H12]
MYIYIMFKVAVKNSIKKSVKKMPKVAALQFYKLLIDLEQKGPVLSDWPNYGKLKGTNTHHCHLSHKWVACWVETLKGIEIEVNYAGSRESAPYA